MYLGRWLRGFGFLALLILVATVFPQFDTTQFMNGLLDYIVVYFAAIMDAYQLGTQSESSATGENGEEGNASRSSNAFATTLIIVILIAVLGSGILLSNWFVQIGQSPQPSATGPKEGETNHQGTPQPDSIDHFYASKVGSSSGDNAALEFVMVLDTGKKYSGAKALRIRNANGTILYENRSVFLRSDFAKWELDNVSLDQQAYRWRVPMGEIDNSPYSQGTAYLGIVVGNSRRYYAQTNITSLP